MRDRDYQLSTTTATNINQLQVRKGRRDVEAIRVAETYGVLQERLQHRRERMRRRDIQTGCKGKGWLELTKAECNKIPGTKFVAK